MSVEDHSIYVICKPNANKERLELELELEFRMISRYVIKVLMLDVGCIEMGGTALTKI